MEDPLKLPERSQLSKYLEPVEVTVLNKYGIKTKATNWIIPKKNIDPIGLEMYSLPYDGEEPEFQGLTYLEVAWLQQARKAAKGDLTALQFFVERVQGKAKQQIEQTTTTINITDFLKSIETGPVVETKIVEITTVEEYDV